MKEKEDNLQKATYNFFYLRTTLNQFTEFSHYQHILEIIISILEIYYQIDIFTLKILI